MGEVVIRRGVPIPPKARRSRFSPKYPFETLEVGDCFEVADCDAGSIRVKAAEEARRTGRQFVTRSLGKGAVGVWRTA